MHREYGEETIAVRTGCVILCLLFAADPMQAVELQARRRLTILGQKQPEKQGGRQAFLADFIAQGTSVLSSDAKMDPGHAQALMQAGAKEWDRMSPTLKDHLGQLPRTALLQNAFALKMIRLMWWPK